MELRIFKSVLAASRRLGVSPGLIRRVLLVGVLASGVSAPLRPQTSPFQDSGSDWKPPWLSELTVGLVAGYDDNLFFQDLGPLAGRSTFVTSIQPSATLLFQGLAGDGVRDRLSLTYEPEIVRYDEDDSLDHENHRLTLAYGAQTETATWRVVNELILTNGRKTAQDWPSPMGLPRSPVIGGPEFRSRTENHEVRGMVMVQKGLGPDWFVRPRAQWWAADFRTEQRDNPIPDPANDFYGNYVDRADFHAGLDVGRRVGSKCYLTLGYRAGIQDQGALIGTPLQYDNHYQVLLIGVEGAPSDRLSYSLQIGPDFRSYGGMIREGDDPHPVEIYADGRLAWAIGKRTELNGRLKLFKFMPGGGAGAMAMRLLNLGLAHELSEAVKLNYGVDVLGSTLSLPDPRGTDWLFTGYVGASLRLSNSLDLALDYKFDSGRSEEDDIYPTPAGPIPGPNGSGREYRRNVLSLSLELAL